MRFLFTWTFALLVHCALANADEHRSFKNVQHIDKPQLYYAYSQYTNSPMASSLKREFKIFAPLNTTQITLFHSTSSNNIKTYQLTLDYTTKHYNVFKHNIYWNSLISRNHEYGKVFSFTGEFSQRKFTLENKDNIDDGILGDNIDCVLYHGVIDESLSSMRSELNGKIIVRPFRNQRVVVRYKSAFGNGHVEAYKLYEMPSEFECWAFEAVVQGRATNAYDVEVQYMYESENGVDVAYVDDNFGRKYKIYKEGVYDNM